MAIEKFSELTRKVTLDDTDDVLVQNDSSKTVSKVSGAVLKAGRVPADGTDAQVLTKTGSTAYAWRDAPTELPSGGTDGQVLTRAGTTAVAWNDSTSGGFLNEDTPAAAVTVTTPTPSTTGGWSDWEDLATIPAVTAAQAGKVVLVGEVHGTVVEASGSGGDRLITESRIVRTRNSADTALSDHVDYSPRNTGGGQFATTFSTASSVSDEELVALTEAETGDIYKLQVRITSQLLSGPTRSMTFSTDRNKLSIASIGGEGPQGSQGPPGPKGEKGDLGPVRSFYVETKTQRVPARATANVSGGRITGFVIGNGGSGYLQSPEVTFTPSAGRGSGATATATVSGGSVTGITVTNGGSGYTVSPTVKIEDPLIITGDLLKWDGLEWTNLLSLPAVTAAQMGRVLLIADIQCASSPYNTVTDEYITEARLIRMRNHREQLLHFDRIHGPRNLSETGGRSEEFAVASQTATINMSYTTEAATGDVFSLQVRFVPDTSGSRKMRFYPDSTDLIMVPV